MEHSCGFQQARRYVWPVCISDQSLPIVLFGDSHPSALRQSVRTTLQPPVGILLDASRSFAGTRRSRSTFGLIDQLQERIESHLQMMLEPLVLLLEHQLAIAKMEFLGPLLGPRENLEE